MAKLRSIVKFLNDELKVKKFEDKSRNGLQIRGKTEISRIGLSTDACMEVFQKSKKLRCEMIIVHHGLFWKGLRDVTGLIKKRADFLKKNKISLYTVHLPLDKNRKYGHNTHMFKLLDAKPEKLFGGVGYIGTMKKPTSLSSIKRKLEKGLNTKCLSFNFGKNKIKKIAIVSGGGSHDIFEAIKNKVDLYITGEPVAYTYHYAKEAKLNVLFGGHYRTENSGVKNIGNLLEDKFDVKTFFIDVPTGL